jgi:hypothetical protein
MHRDYKRLGSSLFGFLGVQWVTSGTDHYQIVDRLKEATKRIIATEFPSFRHLPGVSRGQNGLYEVTPIADNIPKIDKLFRESRTGFAFAVDHGFEPLKACDRWIEWKKTKGLTQ